MIESLQQGQQQLEEANMLDFDSGYDPVSDQVDRDWKKARRKVLYQRVVCAVTHCSVDMMSFGEIRNKLRLGIPHYRGLQQIPLEQIRGRCLPGGRCLLCGRWQPPRLCRSPARDGDD